MKNIRTIVFMVCLMSSGILNAKQVDTVQVLPLAKIDFVSSPNIQYSKEDLQFRSRHLVLEFTGNEKGEIISVNILKSSGILDLDHKVAGQFSQAKLLPYQRNSRYIPVKSRIVLQLNLENASPK